MKKLILFILLLGSLVVFGQRPKIAHAIVSTGDNPPEFTHAIIRLDSAKKHSCEYCGDNTNLESLGVALYYKNHVVMNPTGKLDPSRTTRLLAIALDDYEIPSRDLPDSINLKYDPSLGLWFREVGSTKLSVNPRPDTIWYELKEVKK